MYTVYRDNTDPDSEFPESSKGHQSKEKQSDMAEQEMKHFHIFDKQTNKKRPEKWMLKKPSKTKVFIMSPLFTAHRTIKTQ